MLSEENLSKKQGSWVIQKIDNQIATSEQVPCAIFKFKNDADLPLLEYNEEFCQLFCCTQDQLTYKYNMSFTALLEEDGLSQFDSVIRNWDYDNKKIVFIKHGIYKNGAKNFLQTNISGERIQGEEIFTCVSFDITDLIEEKTQIEEFKELTMLASHQVNMGYFEYSLEEDTAYIRIKGTIFTEDLWDEQGICWNFSKELVKQEFIDSDYINIYNETLSFLKKGEGKAVCELKMKSKNADIIWARLTFVKKQNIKGSQFDVVGILEDITQEKEASRSYLNETLFYQTMLAEKDAYAQLDITLNKITRIGGMWNLYNELIDKITFTELSQQFINKVVHKEDRKQYLEIMNRDNLMESLDNGINRLGYEFRRITEQNKMVWMQLNISLFKDPVTKNVLALMSLKNIDSWKKQELRLMHESSLNPLSNIYSRKVSENVIREYLMSNYEKENSVYMLLEMDNYVQIKKKFGQNILEKSLTRLLDKVSKTFRKSDIIGQFDVNKLIIFIKNITSYKQVTKRLNEFYDELKQEKEISDLSCKIGIAMLTGTVEYEKALSEAEAALQLVKTSDKKKFIYYKEGMTKDKTLDDFIELEDSIEAFNQHDEMDFINKNLGEKFDAFLSETGELSYLINTKNFNLICGNKAFYERIGMTREQCNGMKCYEVMHKRESVCPFCSKANWSTDKFHMWKNLNTNLEQEFLIKNKLVTFEGQEALLTIAIDISNDKSIVDSMENEVMESHSILSGVQRMTDADTLKQSMCLALENMGYFFRADSVRWWKKQSPLEQYECKFSWNRNGTSQDINSGKREIQSWLDGKKWENAIFIESKEEMLCFSYDMYQYMNNHGIRNQRWVQLKDGEEELGCVVIENISSNFQNVAFLEAFTVFVEGEYKKRSLIEAAVYSKEHDALTDLKSRYSFETYMNHYHSDNYGCVGVLLANFNNLKQINSSSGFHTGNYYIQTFANMLKDIFCQQEIFRLNGDEFLVICTDVSRGFLEEKMGLMEKAVKEIGLFSVSYGYAWDDVENDLTVLLEQATQAMKINKKRHYDSVPASVDAERRKMLSDLFKELEHKRFEVFLQPKVDLITEEVVGAEALIRYRHEKVGLVPPSQFIEVLEKNNFIRYIDLFVFEEVCRMQEKWKKEGYIIPSISLNFSRLTLLERNIKNTMETIISQYDVEKKNIEIEITETIANLGKSMLYQAADEIYQAGYLVSLDDFGTKYTNLSILADLNFCILKLDRSLIGELENQNNYKIILENVVHMCKDLGIKVLAEGIESQKQAQFLKEMNCNLGQGYYYGKPMPITEFEKLYKGKK